MKSSDTRQIYYVQDAQQLQTLCLALQGSAWLAVDTEFQREKTYFPKLCLLQLANEQLIACVDPLAIADLSPLFALLQDERIVKVLHSARQDYEIFFHLSGRLPGPVFDTQVAATLCSGDEQISYAALVEQVTGVVLEKGCTRTDWTQRPLTQDQLHYAQDDVRYLGAIYQHQLAVLQQRDLLGWMQDECQSLLEAKTYQAEPSVMWLRIRENNRLTRLQLAVLQALAAWREEQAIARDRPRKWILHDSVLVELVKRNPQDSAALSTVPGMPEGVLTRHGERLLAIIAQARQIPENERPRVVQRVRRSDEEEAMIDVMMALIRKRAQARGVAPFVLGSRKDIDALLNGDASCRLLQGWRFTEVGETLQRFLRGEISIKAVDEHLLIEQALAQD